MNFLLILLLFLVWRSFDFLIIFFSQKIIPYLGFFPYKDQLPGFNLPHWLSSLANFDGLHYIFIARDGYAQYVQAFFPLYPLLIKFLTPLFFNNQLLTGLIISNVSFFLGLILFYKYLKLISSDSIRFNPILSILFLLVFPTSFFFGAIYTEGLFFLLVVATLYFLKKENYLFTGLFAVFASLTRLVGVFLVIPIIVHLVKKLNYVIPVKTGIQTKITLNEINRLDPLLRGNDRRYFILNIRYLLLILSPLLGLGLYCLYLFKTTGDPFFFLTSQPIFGANRSSHLIFLPQVYWRYFKIFLTANWNFQYFSSLIEFLVFNFVFVILVLDLFKNLRIKNCLPAGKAGKLIRNSERLGLNLFSLVNLILPTLTGTFSSIPRYSLFSISLFIYLTDLKNNFIKYLILIIFIVLHILLLGYFTQGYFIS